MRSSKQLAVAVLSSLAVAAAAHAASVDFKDPKRAVGREDNIRVDAQLNDDQLSSGSLVAVTYQIENLSNSPVAIADKVASADYDRDTMTITVSIGAEIPDNSFPHLVIIKPGEKHVLSSCTFAHIAVPSVRTPWTAIPRSLGIRVLVLRDLAPFATLIEQQKAATAALPFPSQLFDKWIDGTSTVSLNAIPIRWRTDSNRLSSAEASSAAGGTF